MVKYDPRIEDALLAEGDAHKYGLEELVGKTIVSAEVVHRPDRDHTPYLQLSFQDGTFLAITPDALDGPEGVLIYNLLTVYFNGKEFCNETLVSR